jgi:hypothetical protein
MRDAMRALHEGHLYVYQAMSAIVRNLRLFQYAFPTDLPNAYTSNACPTALSGTHSSGQWYPAATVHPLVEICVSTSRLKFCSWAKSIYLCRVAVRSTIQAFDGAQRELAGCRSAARHVLSEPIRRRIATTKIRLGSLPVSWQLFWSNGECIMHEAGIMTNVRHSHPYRLNVLGRMLDLWPAPSKPTCQFLAIPHGRQVTFVTRKRATREVEIPSGGINDCRLNPLRYVSASDSGAQRASFDGRCDCGSALASVTARARNLTSPG